MFFIDEFGSLDEKVFRVFLSVHSFVIKFDELLSFVLEDLLLLVKFFTNTEDFRLSGHQLAKVLFEATVESFDSRIDNVGA